jgi:hypothetical protein
MKQLLSFFLLVAIVTSCSMERRHYLPGFHVEHPWNTGEVRSASEEVRYTREDKNARVTIEECSQQQAPHETSHPVTASSAEDDLTIPPVFSPLSTPHSPDTLKKPFQPPKQYREVDPIGRYSVITVLAGVALQKLAGILTWFEVIMPLSFGPGIFIPALVVALVGLCLSAYSAYRVRKFPEKYKKNEWGKAALAILGWQILMSALFAWLLGGLPMG